MNQKKKNSVIFETVDPETNIVTLTQATYDNHITTQHPEMYGEISKIQDCVEKPDIITRDADYETRNYYRNHGDTVLKLYGMNTKVCVDISTARIKTAYFTDSIKIGEPLIWTK